jgi:hypothetical protein
LRHAFASFAVADGTSLYIVGKALGTHRAAPRSDMHIWRKTREERQRNGSRPVSRRHRSADCPAAEIVPIRIR